MEDQLLEKETTGTVGTTEKRITGSIELSVLDLVTYTAQEMKEMGYTIKNNVRELTNKEGGKTLYLGCIDEVSNTWLNIYFTTKTRENMKKDQILEAKDLVFYEISKDRENKPVNPYFVCGLAGTQAGNLV